MAAWLEKKSERMLHLAGCSEKTPSFVSIPLIGPVSNRTPLEYKYKALVAASANLMVTKSTLYFVKRRQPTNYQSILQEKNEDGSVVYTTNTVRDLTRLFLKMELSFLRIIQGH